MPLPTMFARGFWEAASTTPDAVALREHNGRAITFGALRDQVHAYAHVFRSRGVPRGGAVAVILSNRIEFVATYLACIESGIESHASIHDSWKSMSVCFAIDESAGTGGQPVRVRLA